MSLIGRFAAVAMLMLVALSVGWSTPAAAQNTTGEYRGALDSLYLEMRSLWGELDRFKIETRYCRPPPPSKAEAQAELAALEKRVTKLNGRYQAMRQSLLSFLDHNHRLYSELMVDGRDPRDRRWWTRYENSRKKMLDELAAKKAALAAAPEVNCGGTTTQGPAVTTGPPAPPKQQPQSSLPQRPSYDPINWPPMPPHFCSWDEYWKFIIERINPLYEKAAENAELAARFRTQVEVAVNNHVQAGTPVPAALAALRRQAIADVAQQDRLFRESEEIRRRAKAIPVIDCRTPTQTGSVTAPPATGTATTPGPRFQSGSLLDGIRNRLFAIVEEMKAAYERCDLATYERLLNELRELRSQAKLAAGAATGSAEFSNINPKEAEGLADAIREVIRPREWQLHDLKRKCSQQPRTQPPATPSQTGFIPPADRRMAVILEEHNKVRAEVGSPPLIWDESLAAGAAAYAQQLTTLGHASREGRKDIRENLLQSLHGGRSPKQMVGVWIAERRYFRPGIFPNVSTTGNWADVGHYTQMIWPTTTRLGCAIHAGAKYDWTVCRYSPPGNRDGSPILADNSTVVRPERLKLPMGGGMQRIDPPAPPPPPRPTATDPAPDGIESRHPLHEFTYAAFDRHAAAVKACDQAAAQRALDDLRHAISELEKRARDARQLGRFSAIDPDAVEQNLKEARDLLRRAEDKSRKAACPPLPPPPPPAERG